MKFVISSKVCATKTSIYHLRNKTKITQISLDIKNNIVWKVLQERMVRDFGTNNIAKLK